MTKRDLRPDEPASTDDPVAFEALMGAVDHTMVIVTTAVLRSPPSGVASTAPPWSDGQAGGAKNSRAMPSGSRKLTPVP